MIFFLGSETCTLCRSKDEVQKRKKEKKKRLWGGCPFLFYSLLLLCYSPQKSACERPPTKYSTALVFKKTGLDSPPQKQLHHHHLHHHNNHHHQNKIPIHITSFYLFLTIISQFSPSFCTSRKKKCPSFTISLLLLRLHLHCSFSPRQTHRALSSSPPPDDSVNAVSTRL